MSRSTLSIVVPAFNERESLPILIGEIASIEILSAELIEVIVVDDGSTDGSPDLLEGLAARFDRLRVIRFDANRGQTAALAAGFEAARGELVATLDADLQNDPVDLRRLVDVLRESGADMVTGVRRGRKDSRWKRAQSKIGNWVRNRVTGDLVSDTGCTLRVSRRPVVSGLLEFDGAHRFIPTLARVRGAVVVEEPVGHRARRFGRSKYGVWNRAVVGLIDCFRVRGLRKRALR